MENTYYVYIVASRSRNLYTGVTNNLVKRMYEHKKALAPGFTKRYRICRLVYLEPFEDIRSAIEREKQIKSWSRAKRITLIESMNPTWADLAEGWFSRSKKIQIPRPKSGLGMTDKGSELRMTGNDGRAREEKPSF